MVFISGSFARCARCYGLAFGSGMRWEGGRCWMTVERGVRGMNKIGEDVFFFGLVGCC
jgi:hypothetical protein